MPMDVKWHFIGSLQSNKCKILSEIPNLSFIHTVDGIKKAKELDKYFKGNVLLQINTSNEESKSGADPKDCVEISKFIIEQCKNLVFRGLMTIGKETEEKPNPDFECLVRLKSELLPHLPPMPNFELSMGMSNDYLHAIEMGSTMIRVGSKIFGQRQ
jgi:pyridoxal phosphate enzyme (YggS family)